MLGGSHRLSFSLDSHEPAFFVTFDYDTRRDRDNAKGEKVQKNPYCRLVKRARSSVRRFVKHFRSNLSRTQQPVPVDGSRPTPGRHSVSMTPQQRCEQFGNSHQSEAIEDCINFLKNSSRKEVITSSFHL